MSRQPMWFIEETLGKKRAALFKRGGVGLDKFTDLTGRPLSLDELRKTDAKAFELAGL